MGYVILAMAVFLLTLTVVRSNKDESKIKTEEIPTPIKPQKKRKPKARPYRKMQKKQQRNAGKRAMEERNASLYDANNKKNERVLLNDLLNYGSLIDKTTYDDLIDKLLSGAKYVNVPKGTIKELERQKRIRDNN